VQLVIGDINEHVFLLLVADLFKQTLLVIGEFLMSREGWHFGLAARGFYLFACGSGNRFARAEAIQESPNCGNEYRVKLVG